MYTSTAAVRGSAEGIGHGTGIMYTSTAAVREVALYRARDGNYVHVDRCGKRGSVEGVGHVTGIMYTSTAAVREVALRV